MTPRREPHWASPTRNGHGAQQVRQPRACSPAGHRACRRRLPVHHAADRRVLRHSVGGGSAPPGRGPAGVGPAMDRSINPIESPAPPIGDGRSGVLGSTILMRRSYRSGMAGPISWELPVPAPHKTHRARSRRSGATTTRQPAAEPSAATEGPPVGMMPIATPVIRRAILDPAYEDDVYDIEEGKRRAKVSDMQGGTIKADDPRRSILTEHLLGSGRASGAKAAPGEPGKIGAQDPRKSMLTEHLQGTGRAKGMQFGGHDLPSRALGGERTAPISKHLVESGRASIAFGARATKEAQGLGTPVSTGDHGKVEAAAGKHPEQVEAKAKLEKDIEKERTKKYLAEGRRYTGTERESAEVAQFDLALARQDW